MKRHTLCALALAIPLSPLAHAGDEKQYPGAGCLEVNSESGDLQRSGARLTNYGAVRKTMVCPTIRDIETVCSSGGGGIMAVVNIMDNHDDDVACTLTIRRNDGAVLGYNTRWTIDTKTVGMRHLLLYRPFYEADDYFTLECELPPTGAGGTARLYSYKIDESYGC